MPLRQKLPIAELLRHMKAHPGWIPDGPNKAVYEEFLKKQQSFENIPTQEKPQKIKKSEVKKVTQDLKGQYTGEIEKETSSFNRDIESF